MLINIIKLTSTNETNYEAIFRQKSNTELVDLLITSAGENDNTKFNNSLLALQNEVLRRMNH